MLKNLIMKGVNFLVSNKDHLKIEVMNKICVNVFCYENKIVYLVYLSSHKFNDSMDLLLLSNNSVSHYMYIKDFNRFMFNKTKHKGNNIFVKAIYSVLVMKVC